MLEFMWTCVYVSHQLRMIETMVSAWGGGAVRNCSRRFISVKELNLLLVPSAAELLKLFSCSRFNHLPVFMSHCLVKNVLTLPLAPCMAVPQVCSQGAAMLPSWFSSPRDQNTVGARCSEGWRQWNQTGAPLYLLCLLKFASCIWPKVESRCWSACKYLQRWRYWGEGVFSPHIHVPLVWPWEPLSLESHRCSNNDNPSKSNTSKVLTEARSC